MSYTEDPIALAVIRVYGSEQTVHLGALQLFGCHPFPRWQMPKWILECEKCGNGFDYCRIAETMPLDLPFKPDVANGGTCVCPNCGQRAIYKRTDLLYRPG